MGLISLLGIWTLRLTRRPCMRPSLLLGTSCRRRLCVTQRPECRRVMDLWVMIILNRVMHHLLQWMGNFWGTRWFVWNMASRRMGREKDTVLKQKDCWRLIGHWRRKDYWVSGCSCQMNCESHCLHILRYQFSRYKKDTSP